MSTVLRSQAFPSSRHHRAGLLRKLRAAVAHRVDSRKLELLAADDLSRLHEEAEEELALRIRSVSRWLGSPYGGLVQRAVKVKLCQVDDEGVLKERLRLTDEGVAAIAKRLGINFVLFSPEDTAGWLICRVQATFADGSTVECAGRAKSADSDAAQRAQAVAHRLAVYGRIGIPTGKPVENLDMDFVSRVRDDEWEAEVVDPWATHLPPLAPSPGSTLDTEEPSAPEPAPVAPPPHVTAPAIAAGLLAAKPKPAGLVRVDKRSVDAASGEINPAPRETAALDVMRRDLNRYLRESGYHDDLANQRVIQEGLGLQQPRTIGELGEAEVQVLLEDKEGLFPPKTAPVLQDSLRI